MLCMTEQYCFIKIAFYVTELMFTQWISCSFNTRANATDWHLSSPFPQVSAF